MKGSPICTDGRFDSDLSEISSEANVAPWIPSRPVFEPTIKIGFPTPAERAVAILSVLTMPTDIALTSGLPV